ncbi:MAG: hypothetical protein AAB468_00120 [Patescibacteria group bacterium]
MGKTKPKVTKSSFLVVPIYRKVAKKKLLVLDDIFIMSNENGVIEENDEPEVVVAHLEPFLREWRDAVHVVNSVGQLMDVDFQVGNRFGVGFYIIKQTGKQATFEAIRDAVSVMDPGSSPCLDDAFAAISELSVHLANMYLDTGTGYDYSRDYGNDVILNLIGKFAVEIAKLGIPTTIELKSK